MTTGNLELKNNVIQKKTFKYVAPDGGWGYIVTAAVSLTFIATVVPLCVFGVVFGNFLRCIGDETYGTTLANGIFNTVLSFTGLLANRLLQTYTCRKVGLLGAVLFFLGNFGIVFVTNLSQLLITFGVLQGLGFGLMMPSIFTAFHQYFDVRKNVIMGLCQASIVAVTIAFPVFTKILLDAYGWRGTVFLFAGLSLHCIPAMLTFQPVKWHMKKVAITDEEMHDVAKVGKEEEPLLLNKQTEKFITSNQDVKVPKHQRPSIVSIGSMALSSDHINRAHKNVSEVERKGCWASISESLDLALFKDPVYVNIACGLSLSLTSDLAFLSLLPLILVNAGFPAANITAIMTIYFISDLCSRLFLSFLSAIYDVRNRYVFLIGSLLSAFFRTLLMLNNNFYWVVTNCIALGFLRCFIQTPLPLVIAEEYGNRFTTAFSLYMVVCGVVSLIFGPLIGLVKQLTGSDVMVVHLLTLAYLLCGIPWSIELLFEKFRGIKSKQGNDVEMKQVEA